MMKQIIPSPPKNRKEEKNKESMTTGLFLISIETGCFRYSESPNQLLILGMHHALAADILLCCFDDGQDSPYYYLFILIVQ